MQSASYNSVIGEIKRRLSITDLVGTYLSLKKSGKGYIGLCPFHDDKNPSLHVSEEKGLFHCFSCGAGGDIFGFVMRKKGLDFKDALEDLAKLADVKLTSNKRTTKKTSQENLLLRLNKLVLTYFQKNLHSNSKAKEARNYLKKRGLSENIVKQFKLGYSLPQWDGLVEFLNSKKIPLKLSSDLGLIIKRSSSEGYYDRFRDRIIFPIINVNGDVVGFGGRLVEENDQPKYINSPESIIYKKRNTLYGLYNSREHIRTEGYAILVEGYMDYLSLFSNGIKNVVATLGTSITSEHATLLRRYTDNLIIIYDADEAGKRSSIKAGEYFIEKGIMPKIVALDEGYDPDTYIKENGKEKVLDIVHDSVDLPDYIIDETFKKYNLRQLSRKHAVDYLIRFLSKIYDPIDRSQFISKISNIFGIREHDIYSRIDTKTTRSNIEPFENNLLDINPNELLIVKALIKFPNLKYQLDDDLVDYFIDEDIKIIFQKIITADHEQDVGLLINSFQSESVQNTFSQAFFASDEVKDEDTALKILSDCTKRLKLKIINSELKNIREQMHLKSSDNDYNKEKELIRSYRDLVNEEKKLREELYEL